MFYKKVRTTALFLGIQLAVAGPLLAQRTPLRTGSNMFTTHQDVEMGRALARDAANTFIPPEDQTTRAYVRRLGQELAARAPGYKYPYQFEVFIDPEGRSLALPGGFIYVSSGLVMSMQNEPELAAVLAHQISHVAARHGTQEVSALYSRQRDNPFGRPSVNDAISRLHITIDSNSPVAKYTPQEEQDADTIATQILYDTRFDPSRMTVAFQRLENDPEDTSREFLANHPVQPARLAAIRRELQRLGSLPGSWRGDSVAFRSAQDALRGETPFGLANAVDRDPPLAPSSRMTTYRGGAFEIRYPDNWRVDDRGGSVMLAPDGGSVSGSLAYGMLMNTFQPDSRSNLFGRNSFNLPGGILDSTGVSSATDQLIEELRRSNPNMRVVRRTPKRVDGYEAMTVELNNDSPIGGTEVNVLTAVLHSNGLLYYFMGVAPQADINQYSQVFDRMTTSIRFY